MDTDTREGSRVADRLAAHDEAHVYPTCGGPGVQFGKAVIEECRLALDPLKGEAVLAGNIGVCALRLSRLVGDDVPRLLTERMLLPHRIRHDFTWYRHYRNRMAPIREVCGRLDEVSVLLEAWPLSGAELQRAQEVIDMMLHYAAVLGCAHRTESDSAWVNLVQACEARIQLLATSV